MKKNSTFYDLIVKKRLLAVWLLLFLFLISNKNFAQTFCRPTTHSTDTGGVCLGTTGVSNPTLAYDSSLNTYATITNSLGVACFAEETVTFNQTAKAGDQIVLYYGNGSALISAGVLANSTIQPLLSGASAGSAVPLSGLVNLQLLDNGENINVVKYTLTSDANQIKIQTGGLVSLLINLRVYDVRLQFAKPTITNGETQSVCFGQSIALSATAAAGTTISWYDSPTAITPLSTTGSYTTPALTASTTYYVSTSRIAGCESDQRLPVTINVIEPIVPVVSTTGTTICSAGATQATTLSVVNPVLGTTYSWYDAQTGGTLLTTGSTYTPTVPTGTSTFYVEASIGTCKSTRTQVNVTSTPVPGPATILTQSVSIISGQNATLSASTAEPGVSLDWYDAASGGTKLLANSNTFTTPILTASKTYYVESVNLAGGCVSATRVPVPVTVIAAALGGCLEANSQQTTQNGLCLLCFSTTPNNSVDGNTTTAARLTLPVGLLNGWIQQTLQFNNPGLAGDIVDVELELPGGIADLSLLGAVSLATYNGATYNNDRVSTNNNTLVTLQLLSGNRFKASIVAGANFDRVEVRLGGLVSALTNLDIYQASYRYKAPTFAGNTAICGGQTTTLTANLALGETIKWYDALTGGNLLSSVPSYTTPALTADATYYVEVTRGNCVNSERNPVTVTVSNPVAPSTISVVPLNLCSGESTTITIQSPVAGTTYRWYDAATAGNLVFTGTSYTTPNLTAPTTYHVEAVIGSCVSTRTPVSVNVNSRPSAPVPVSSSVIIQPGQTVMLAVTAEAGMNYNWYDAATGGNLLQASSSTYIPNPVVTTNKTFYVETVAGASDCKSSSRTAINVLVTNTVSSCLKPSAQAITVDPGLLCVLCNGNNGANAVDADPNNFSSLTITAGVLNSYIQQALEFTTPGQAGDIIDVELELPGGLADIALLGSVSIGTSYLGTENPGRLAVNNSILNLQVLSGNKFKVSYPATAAFDKVEIRLGALVGLLTTLNVYGASYRFPNATISGAADPICAGGTTTLSASSTLGTELFKWYDAPTGGTEVNVSSPISFTTTTIYYVEATRSGCVNSVRQPVTITVLPIPTAADITIASPLTASCNGTVVLTPTSALAGATFKYYLDQNKTQVVAGTIDPSTGALTINGLTAANSPYTYYVSVLNGGTCENINGTLKEVVVNYPAGSALTVSSPFAGCAKVNLRDAITNFDTSGNTTYTFFDASNNPITDVAAANIVADGTYFIQAQTAGVDCPSVKLPVVVTINPLPTLTGVTSSIAVIKDSSVTLNATSNGTITWYDPQGNLLSSNIVGPLNTVGVFTYTVVATNANGTCTTSQTVTINVIDPATCDTLLERVYANTELSGSIITGAVTSGPLAVDTDPSTYSTITTGLGLLGIGTTWQNLQWPTTIAKGTPVTVKLGLQNSLLAVGGSISVIGTKRDGSNNPVDIGTLQSVSGSLLTLLPGQNSFEYTFVPSNTAGVQDYDGIRVQLGSVLSVAQNINVYDAYYKKQVTQIACGQGDIEDIFSGAKEQAGLGVLTATVGVSNPWNVADGDVATYATMFNGVGVLADAELTTTFRTPSMVGDSLRITISKPGTLLSLGVLSGLSIQLYSGNIAVGPPIQGNDGNLLTLKLLAGDTMAMTIVSPQTQPYDKVVITLGGVANVLDQLRVHTIDRVTNTKVIGSDPDNKITVCPGAAITLAVTPKSCADYAWYDTPIGGTPLTSGQTYTLPATLAAGTYKYYVQPIRYGCAALERGEVTVVVRATTPAAAIANVTVNGGPGTIICSETGTVTLDAILNGATTLTNQIYYWYSFNGTTSQLIAGETTPKLMLNGLIPGTYTYYVGVSADEYCETAAADRKQVTFTILPSSLESDIDVNNASICLGTPATLTPTTALTSPVFFWYLDANKTQPIFDSSVINGVTYAVNAVNGTLTATGLTAAMSPVSYYVAVTSDNTCQNKNGELKVATVIVNDPPTPTSTNNPQNFCSADQPTVANLQANEVNVVWYLASSGGTSLDPTTALVNGTIYYGAIKDLLGCESSVRSAITVNVNDPGTPTTADATQDFCLVNAPTIASIQLNETNIVWYDALNGGNLIPSTTVLTSRTYYAAIRDASGCESVLRLPVTINVTDPVTPTTTQASQTFCSGNNPTVASIQVNESNIVWYRTENGGTPIASTAALVSGDYFAALKDATTNCESSVRLKVTVTVGNSNNPTTNNTAQNFCSTSNPTFASIQVNESNVSWFTTDTGGTAIPLATALTSGTYYGEITEPVTGCKSATRLMVSITIVNPMATPTTNSLTQNFCSVNAPKVANIQVNESNVIWYSTPTGGTAIPSTADLANGVYYGVVASGSGCENPVRLAITVIINTPLLVTTPRTTQTFCLSAVPSIEDIVVNEANVVWYTSANGGTPLAANTPLTATTYYAAALSNTTNGCDGVSRLGVAVSFENDAMVPITTTDDTPCVFQGITYSIANGKSDYIWTIENGTITSGGGNADGTVTVSWSDIGPGKVSVAYINTCNERTIKSLNVNVATCSDLTITNTVNNPAPNFGEQITFTVTVNNVGEGNFINTIVSELLPSGFDLVSASTTAGTYDLTTQLWTIPALNAGQSVVLTIVAEVLPSGNYTNVATVEISTPLDVDASNNSASVTVVPVCLTVYNEFTPNNDGANDLFRIDCIESYPNNELKVYNRYGSLVYSKQHYENDWDGTANVSGVINRGDMLPTGTYFYVITIGDGTVKKGWLSIMR
ncbi:gliding motility-associated C-terminal domain-containing protein [Flavobacterium piscis]|uniref:Immunoglobulin domain-containing protein n=1 Tax=Flavobacterium piscis TaxID=1114874 RepID=A0ABX2XLW9_9FLAO|nr:gliding motility-associated C-terminal domain-containing protein [Flavobacterium piscis]OCB73250.1 hypothetical protein FLP_11070 [Flavobacterium piscis]